VIRTIWYDTEGSPLRMKRLTRYAHVDRGNEGWIVVKDCRRPFRGPTSLQPRGWLRLAVKAAMRVGRITQGCRLPDVSGN
jgi:hypothetical protein